MATIAERCVSDISALKARSVRVALRRGTARLIIVALVAALVLPAGPAIALGAPDSFADLAQKLLPSVVNISTSQKVKPNQGGPDRPRFPPGSPFEDFFREFFERQQRRGAPQQHSTSLGSGFVIDPSGYVVTNNHVIAEADKITVTFHDDMKLKAKVIGRDPKTDLALLKVNPPKPLPAVRFGDSNRLRVGDWVVAIGNPFGLGGTVTAGIISARGRDINSGPYDDFLQTDASINKGNSGGPMFNLRGEVVGVNTAIFSPSGGSVGIGFAIPASLAGPIVSQLRKFGRARRGWLGVRIQSVTKEIAQGLGLKEATGALVASVTEGGPAAKGNILVGDVILRFNRKKVAEMRHLPRIVAETAVGRTVDVDVWRKGRRRTLQVLLGEFPSEMQTASLTPGPKSSVAPAVETLGLELSVLNPELREKFKLGEEAKGVVVTKVAEDSPAAKKRIQPGDIIRKIGSQQQPVRSPAQVKKKVEEARKNKVKSILVLVEREGSQRFVAIVLDPG